MSWNPGIGTPCPDPTRGQTPFPVGDRPNSRSVPIKPWHDRDDDEKQDSEYRGFLRLAPLLKDADDVCKWGRRRWDAEEPQHDPAEVGGRAGAFVSRDR